MPASTVKGEYLFMFVWSDIFSACATFIIRKNESLQGSRVFITPNTKPGKEIISCLVKAVQGQVCSFPLVVLQICLYLFKQYF